MTDFSDINKNNRFFNKVVKTETCWNWTASNRGNGYGCMKYNKKVINSHRLSWMMHNGKRLYK